MAPEYLYRGEISAQSDIYSLGLVIIEIATGEQNPREKDQPSARSFVDKVRGNITLLFDKQSIFHTFCLFIVTKHLDSTSVGA